MPQFLSKEDAEILAARRTTEESAVYLDFLRSLSPGEYGAVKLMPGENERGVKRRLGLMAKRLGWRLLYKPSVNKDGERIVLFQILREDEKAKRGPTPFQRDILTTALTTAE